MFLVLVSVDLYLRKHHRPMTYTTIVSTSAIGALIIFMIYISSNKEQGRKGVWLFPASVSFLFLLYSIQTILEEGSLGFWTSHTSSLWGTQIWVDLLIAIGVGWYFVVPRAKGLGMRTLPWVFIILGTGCIGFLAMVARVFYLEERNTMQNVGT